MSLERWERFSRAGIAPRGDSAGSLPLPAGSAVLARTRCRTGDILRVYRRSQI